MKDYYAGRPWFLTYESTVEVLSSYASAGQSYILAPEGFQNDTSCHALAGELETLYPLKNFTNGTGTTTEARVIDCCFCNAPEMVHSTYQQ